MKRTVFSRVIWAVTALLLLPAGCWRTETPQPSPAPVPSKAVRPAADNAAAPSAALRRVHVFVSGRVQGVGFRAFTEEHARTLGLSGTVKNLSDGRVEAIVEGPPDKVAQLLALLKKGPSLAEVDNVEATDETPTREFKEFSVLY